MAACVYTDERCLLHDPGPFHPEQPERLRAIWTAVEDLTKGGVTMRREGREATSRELGLGHDPVYLRRLEEACQCAMPFLDTPDCPLSPRTFDAARVAAGTVIAACEDVATGRTKRAFCAVRPPGHHAMHDRAMGFCYLCNLALGVRRARELGVDRVAIVDFDVHHGNGTQRAFYEDPQVLYISLHGDPRYVYPGTGYAEERGSGPGRGTTLNIPLPLGSGDAEYRAAFAGQVVPTLDRFGAQLLAISAGFDAHREDLLVRQIGVGDETFDWMTDQLVAWADAHAAGRVVSVLEGGYSTDVLTRCVRSHVERMR